MPHFIGNIERLPLLDQVQVRNDQNAILFRQNCALQNLDFVKTD